MLVYPEIDPVAIELGPLKVHWYGLMYLFAFAAAWWLIRVRARHNTAGWKTEHADDLVFYCALGIVAGGRLGYILFYGWDNIVRDPLTILRIWEGGMSFHGGMLGVFVALALYARKTGRTFFEVSDFIAPMVPPGLLAGRIGNFINGELWGKPTDVPWGMQVNHPLHGLQVLHPSQLYEAALEGLALFVILWWFSASPRPRMAVSGLFLVGYGVFRFLVEFVRVPDAHLGYLAFGWLTMGQLLTLPMILFGMVFLFMAYRRQVT